MILFPLIYTAFFICEKKGITVNSNEFEDNYLNYLIKFNKNIDENLQNVFRKTNFENNLEYIIQHNSKNYKIALNEMADFTKDEILTRFNFLNIHEFENLKYFDEHKTKNDYTNYNETDFIFGTNEMSWATVNNPVRFPVVSEVYNQVIFCSYYFSK
jgi:hypothetical protein